MKILCLLTLLLVSSLVFSRTKNFIDLPYIETTASIDTAVTPDRIYLTILISEKDSKGKLTLEELENKMAEKLESIGVDLKKQLVLADLSSNFKRYFLKQQDVLKTKSYTLLVYDAKTAGSVIVELENEGISNVHLDRTEYSKMEELKMALKSKAILKAKQNALAMSAPLNQKIGNAIYISDQGNHSELATGLAGRMAGIVVQG